MPSQPVQPMTTPPPTTGGGGGSSKLIFIMVGVALLGVIGAIIPMLMFSGMSCGGSNEPPVPLAINTPVQGTLSRAHPYRLYEIGITQPSQLTVSLNSQFDNYLELYAGDSQTPMMENDDGGSGLNAQLSTVLQPNIYYILVRPYSEGTGPFTITAAVMPVGQ